MTEVQPELIICYLGLKFNTYDNFEPYYFDADSVMPDPTRSLLSASCFEQLQEPHFPYVDGSLSMWLLAQSRGCWSVIQARAYKAVS